MSSRMASLAGPPLAPYEARTLTQLLCLAVDRFRAQPALGVAGATTVFSYGDVEARVAGAAAMLRGMGIGRGDRVAILSTNSPEWAIADYAILSLGAVTVPVYPTLPADQVGVILRDSGAKLVFTAGDDQGTKVARVEGAPDVLPLARLTGTASTADVAAWREQALAIAPGDLATLIYTSGTTGTPKGVMLTHANLASMVAATRQHGSLDVHPGEVALSILPLSHVFERAADYFFLGHGVTIIYAESMQTVVRDVGTVRPHHVIAVPRLFEKIHAAFTSAPGMKGRIARWANDVAWAWANATTTGTTPGAALRARHALADRLVYRVLRERLGGRMRTFICGGAPLEPRVGALFHAAGIPVYEGYGLTETSPVISANRPGAVRLGSAGVPYPGVEVRLGAESEVQVRGPGVTPGYWGRAEETAAAFTADGWFRTGDVGDFRDGFLFIVDRLKDLIVTAGGKNVAPQPIEQRVATSPYVSQAVVIGDRRPYLVMLVVPTPDADPARLPAAIAHLLEGFAGVERPKRMAVVREEFTQENALLTPTLKVRRRAVERAYAGLLDELYAGSTGVAIPSANEG